MLPTHLPSKFRGYVALIGGSFVQFAYGCVYSYGNLVPYFASYLAYAEYHQSTQPFSTNELISIYRNQIMKFDLIYSLRFIIFAISLYYSSRLEIKLGPKKTLIIASSLMSCGFFLTFFALKYGGSNAFLLCFCTLSVIWTAGMGISFPLQMIVGMRWFPKRRGFVGGFSIGLFGAGGFIFDYLESLIVNPSNIKFTQNIGYVEQPEIIERIPVMCIYLAIVMAGMQSISILCIKNPPWFKRTQKDGEKNINSMQMEYEKYSLTVKQAMGFSALWILFLQTFLYVLISNVALLQWKLFAVNDLLILNDKYLSIVGSVCALANGCGRIFWGWFLDFTGNSYRMSQGLMSSIMTLFIISWPLCSYSPMIMFPIWNFIIWFNVNGCFALYGSVISFTFGAKFVGSFFGFFAIAELFSTLFVSVFSAYIHSWFHGWTNYLLMIGAISLCTVILSPIYNPYIDRKQYLFELTLKKTEKKRLMECNRDSINNSYETFQ